MHTENFSRTYPARVPANLYDAVRDQIMSRRGLTRIKHSEVFTEALCEYLRLKQAEEEAQSLERLAVSRRKTAALLDDVLAYSITGKTSVED